MSWLATLPFDAGNTKLRHALIFSVFLAAELGADMLGFVFSTTKRLTTEEFVRSFAEKIRVCHPERSANGVEGSPLLVGVITDPESPEGKTAIKLANPR